MFWEQMAAYRKRAALTAREETGQKKRGHRIRPIV